ncbi:hypothetical protein T07_3441 [Trichinella nelsoni]|uniref:Uncharacterized protein n=1 Tax=Trichinella nelsoni TaxID=6336 RepID=A0A0V0RKR6_9BILA|nr:hypothetical protein T07_3441 [Trichinella nelsoni]
MLLTFLAFTFTVKRLKAMLNRPDGTGRVVSTMTEGPVEPGRR